MKKFLILLALSVATCAAQTSTEINPGRIGWPLNPNTNIQAAAIADQKETVTYTGADGTNPLLVDAHASSISASPAINVLLPSTGYKKAFVAANSLDTNGWLALTGNVNGTGCPGLELGPGGSTARNSFIYSCPTGSPNLQFNVNPIFTPALVTDTPALQIKAASSGLNTQPALSITVPSSGGQYALEAFNGTDSQPWAALQGPHTSGMIVTPASLAFGPGGSFAPDTFLSRTSRNQFQVSGELIVAGGQQVTGLLQAFSGFQNIAITVATLPTASTSQNVQFVVNDGTSSSDCTVGGGSHYLLCVSTGTVWMPLGGGGGTWGSITGTLSSQTDLQTALNAKAAIASPTFTGTASAPTVVASTTVTTPSLTLNGGTPLTSQSSANSQVVTCPTGGTSTQYCGADGAWHAAAGGSVTSVTASAPLTSSGGTTPVISASVQGTDSNLLSAGAISGTGAMLCTDANGGATTSGCPSGGGSSGATLVTCGGSNDTSAIQTALNGAGHVALTGSCVLGASSGPLTIKSNTWLDAGTASVTYAPGTWSYAMANTQIAQTVNRSFTDAVTTAGSATITSATAAFTQADVGQSIKCTGALGTLPGLTGYTNISTTDLHTRIAQVVSGTSAVLDDAPGVSINPATCAIIYRDHDIRVSGGKWSFGGAAVSSTQAQEWAFVSVNNLTIDSPWMQADTTGLPSSNGSKFIGVADASGLRIINPTFNSWVTLQDGIDIYGPNRDFLIRGVSGHTGDNAVAVTPFGDGGYWTPPLTQGVVKGGVIEDTSASAGYGVIRLFGPDSGSKMLIDEITINGCHAGSFYQNGFPGGTGDCVQLVNGNMGTIKINGVDGLMVGSSVSVSGTTVATLSANNLSNSYQPFSSGGHLLNISNGAVIDNLEADLKSDGYNYATALSVVGSTINQAKISARMWNLSGAINAPFYFQQDTLGHISLSGDLNYNTSTAPTSGIVAFLGGSFKKLTLNSFYVDHQSGSLASNSLVNLTNWSGTNVTPGDIEMHDVSFTAPATLASPPYLLANNTTTAISPLLSNIRLNYVNGCIYGTTGTASLLNLYATNLSTPTSCTVASVSVPQIYPAVTYTNEAASHNTTTIATVPAGTYQYECFLTTGTTTGTGTVQLEVINPTATAWVAGPTMTLSANAVASYSPTMVLTGSTTLRYQLNYTAGTGGSYTGGCGAVRVQ